MSDEFTHDVFLSHSSKDKKVVGELAERLKADGLRVWFDAWAIKPGDSIPAKIEEGLERSRVLVLCMSANAFGSDWAQLEAGTFRFRDPLNRDRRFLPLRLDDGPIKGSLGQFLYIDWRTGEREEEYGKLLEACRLPALVATAFSGFRTAPPRFALGESAQAGQSRETIGDANIGIAVSQTVSLLKEMILPDSIASLDWRYVVAASPLSWRQARQKIGGYPKLRRTSSDHVGIRGLIYSFGVVSELTRLPDLVDPGDFKPEVCFSVANLYCLGSPKANRWTGKLLAEFCERWKPEFAFRPDPNSEDLRDVHVDIHMDRRLWLPAGYSERDHRYQRDFGLVVRGPHPRDETAMLMLLAGRGAVGTEAACRAVTEQRCLDQIKQRLAVSGVILQNHQQPFWAIVEMERNSDDLGETRPESLRVLHAETFERR